MMLSVLRGLTLTCGSTSALAKLVPGVVPAFVEQVPYGLGPETTTSVPARTDVLKTMSAPLAMATAAIRRFMNTLLAHAHERLLPRHADQSPHNGDARRAADYPNRSPPRRPARRRSSPSVNRLLIGPVNAIVRPRSGRGNRSPASGRRGGGESQPWV